MSTVDGRSGETGTASSDKSYSYDKRIGEADPDWPDWYADHMVRERSGRELPA